MGLGRGIAGSREPEQDGCFLARGEYECRWFVRMNNTGGPVDVWQVDCIDVSELLTSAHGYQYFPGTIHPDQLTLIKTDIPAVDVPNTPRDAVQKGFCSELTIHHSGAGRGSSG